MSWTVLIGLPPGRPAVRPVGARGDAEQRLQRGGDLVGRRSPGRPRSGPGSPPTGRRPAAGPGLRRRPAEPRDRTGAGGHRPSASRRPRSPWDGRPAPGPGGASSRANALVITSRWKVASPGTPSGRPRGNSQYSARGGCIRSATDRTEIRATVASPAASNTWESTHTVREQSGQTGVSSTTSTPSWRRASAAVGPESSRTVATSSGWLPAKETWRGATRPMMPSAASSSSRSMG